MTDEEELRRAAAARPIIDGDPHTFLVEVHSLLEGYVATLDRAKQEDLALRLLNPKKR